MKSYFADLKLFFERAHAAGGTVVLHVEPDMWGYIEQTTGDDATKYRVAVDMDGLPNNAAGFAQAIVRLRDEYAPNVVLGYHVSVWGTNTDIAVQDPPNRDVDKLARRAAAFYRSLGAKFDVSFAEFDDRDSGFNQLVLGDNGASWFKKADFARHARFLRGYSRAAAPADRRVADTAREHADAGDGQHAVGTTRTTVCSGCSGAAVRGI